MLYVSLTVHLKWLHLFTLRDFHVSKAKHTGHRDSVVLAAAFFPSNFESSSSAFLLLFMGFSFKEIQWLRHTSPVSAVCSDRLTLHAQPIRAVLGLQDKAIAVLASILGGGCRALPPAPVSALGPAGRPLAPRGPPAIHCHKKTKTSNRSKREGAS